MSGVIILGTLKFSYVCHKLLKMPQSAMAVVDVAVGWRSNWCCKEYLLAEMNCICGGGIPPLVRSGSEGGNALLLGIKL